MKRIKKLLPKQENIRKHFMILLTALAIAFCLPISSTRAEESPAVSDTMSSGSMAPYTQDYLDYMALSSEEKSSLREPLAVDVGIPCQISTYTDYPEVYDPRVDEDAATVRDQANTNTCWTFSATTNLTYYFMKLGNSETMFSPLHMAYATSYIPGQPCTGLELPTHGVDDGGNQLIAMSYFFNGMGPVYEEDFPFKSYDEDEDGNTIVTVFPRASLLLNPTATVKDYSLFSYTNETILEVPLETRIDHLKSLIYNYGSADVGAFFDSVYWNDEYNSYHYSEESVSSNHAVTVIGWDDTFPKENFTVEPENDGAWIVQNSWGSEWGDEGFFYVSYDDWPTYEMYSAVTNAVMGTQTYDHRYIYDETGVFLYWVDDNEPREYGYAANVYNKQAGTELLTQISIGSIYNGMTICDVYVVDDIDSDGLKNIDVENLTPVLEEAAFSGTGYHTVDLETPVTLNGESFAVIIRYYTPGFKGPVPLDNPEYNEDSQTGISFYSATGNSGSWQDISAEKCNCAFKVFTVDADKDEKVKVTFEGRSEDSVIYLCYENEGEFFEILPVADGSYSLAEGTVFYFEEFVPAADASGSMSTYSGIFELTDTEPETKIISTEDADVMRRVEEIEGIIAALPDMVSPDDTEEEQQIKAAKEFYDALTDYEKALIPAKTIEKLESLLADLVDYCIIEGNGSIWEKGSSSGLTFVANGAYGKFIGIEIDDKAVDESGYTVTSGSTIITLNPEYLNTFVSGEHNLTVRYTDGETTGTFSITGEVASEEDTTEESITAEVNENDKTTSVNQKGEITSPETGDNSNNALCIAIMLASGTAVIGMALYSYGRKYRR